MFGMLLLFAGGCAFAGTGGENATEKINRNEVNGIVFQADNRKPIRDVTITAYATGKREKTVSSDGNGNFIFDGLKSGTYRFVFERQGYRKVVKDKVVIRTDEGFQLNVGMDEEEEFNWVSGSLQLLGGDR